MTQENEFAKLFNYPDGQILVFAYGVNEGVRLKFMSSIGIKDNKPDSRVIYFGRDDRIVDWIENTKERFNSITAETARQVFE